jgi:hypothetical protein
MAVVFGLVLLCAFALEWLSSPLADLVIRAVTGRR